MKIYCTPQKDNENKYTSDLKVILFGKSGENTDGHIGDLIWNEIKREKINPSLQAWDLLSIALSVTSADYAGHRQESHDGWTRVFEMIIAVNDTNFWNAQASLLSKLFGFLTSDRWYFNFVDGGFQPEPPKTSEIKTFDNDSIVLLSGGLDSLIGIIDLIAKDHTPVAVSQLVLGDAEKQRDFSKIFTQEVPHVQLNHNVSIPNSETPSSQRARSIIFLAYGILIATCLKKYEKREPVTIFMCENGYISINPPLTGMRIGSLSTRTTHPIFLKLFQELVNNTGLNVRIENPYQFLTKGQMLINCVNQPLLKQHAYKSTSCGRYKRHGHKHCGRCIPCLVRRAAFKTWGVTDQTNYIYDDLSINSPNYSQYDDVKSIAIAIKELENTGIDRWIGAHLNTAILGDTANYKNTVQEGLNELKKLLQAYSII
jgi:7-cyano-7-deazaguanine synthase in queuosine biosynthesis